MEYRVYPPCHSAGGAAQCVSHVYKHTWPELVGKPGEEAKATIERDNPLVTAIIVPPDRAVVFNYCCNRVWVKVDEQGNVNLEPILG